MENNFANNLKHFRVQSGMTQEDLAKKLDKDYSTIGKWESGQRSPTMLDVIRLSEIFDINIERLMLNNNYLNNESDSKIDLLTQYKILFDKDDKLTDEQKKFFIEFLEEKHKEIDKKIDIE